MLPVPLLAFLLADMRQENKYAHEIEKWRQEREARLKAEDGWLSLVGLFWLKDGENSVGSDPTSDVVLPKRAPSHVGTITLHDGHTTLKLNSGVDATVNAKHANPMELRDDEKDDPDIVHLGSLRFYVIRRAGKRGVRVKDPDSEYRRSFTGLKWYAPKPEWNITAKWVPYDKPKKIVFETMVNLPEEQDSPGFAVFTKSGKEYRLEPTIEDGELFFVFRDKTAGKTTYPASRFLKTAMPSGGKVQIDFNKAYNPPCVFTPYATCPLPPPGNRLNLTIDAGEMMYPSPEAAAKHD